ncbi:MAG: crossover junction endodeoxyribonuclease RuvC [Candidatus Paceibacteria bacterium]
MKVLAFDPGYDRLGVAVMEHCDGKEKLLFSTCITTKKEDLLPDRLLIIGEAVEDLLTTHCPDAIAIETLFFNKNAKTAIGVAQARGIVIYLAKKSECIVYEFGPQEIKIAVTGYGASDKTAVYQMLERLITNIPTKAHDDEYDAIAVGVTCLAHHRSQ